MNNWKQVEEWECPRCGEDGESIYSCSLCQKLRNNQPVNLDLLMIDKFNEDDDEQKSQQLPQGIMLYSIFKKSDPRKGWGGYKFWFYPGEFISPINKRLEGLHIHVIAEGDIRVYLDRELRMEEKTRGIPEHKWGDIKKFVKRHYLYIMERAKNKLREAGVI